MKLRIGARGSPLSLAQTELVVAALSPHLEVEVVPIRTTGDGLADLVCHFGVRAAGFSGAVTQAVLEGRTTDGDGLVGRDEVRIVH